MSWRFLAQTIFIGLAIDLVGLFYGFTLVNPLLFTLDASVHEETGDKHSKGGGATFYLDALKQRLPNYRIQLMPEGVMSNCRGFWLFGKDALAE